MLFNSENAKKASDAVQKYNGSGALEIYHECDNQGLSLTEYLETIDPTEVDMDGNPTTQLDALERHLMVNDIKTQGPNQATLQQLMTKANYLVPEMVRREIMFGMNVAEKFSYRDCIATTVPSKTTTYHPLYIPEMNRSATAARNRKAMSNKPVGKGGSFPVVSIHKREKDVVIQDNGRTIETAYATIRDYGWSDFAVFLRLIGAQLACDKLYDIYDLGINGDGTVGAATDTFDGTAGTLSYNDLSHAHASFDAPFTMNRILAPLDSLETILSMPQFQDPLSGWEFQKNGKMVSPMGSKLKQVSSSAAGDPTGTVIVALDARYAVKEVQSQKLMVEAEKILSRKFEQATVSEESEFCVIADGALKRIVWT